MAVKYFIADLPPYDCGINLQPQCLQTRASFSTSSRQSGHFTCVSGVGSPGARFKDGSTNTARSAKIEKNSPATNQPPVLRPRLDAAKAVTIAKPSHTIRNSMPPPR